MNYWLHYIVSNLIHSTVIIPYPPSSQGRYPLWWFLQSKAERQIVFGRSKVHRTSWGVNCTSTPVRHSNEVLQQNGQRILVTYLWQSERCVVDWWFKHLLVKPKLLVRIPTMAQYVKPIFWGDISAISLRLNHREFLFDIIVGEVKGFLWGI